MSAALTAGKRRTCQATRSKATRRSASFHAATRSSVVPRTPRSHSWAMTALWRTSPTTSTAIATPVSRRALIDDRHQCQPEADDAHATREELRKAAAGEQVELVADSLAHGGVRAMRDPVGEPVHEGKARVHLDRKAAVRRGDEDAPADPDHLGDELPLAFATADVLDDGVGEHDVERAVLERQSARVALDVRDLRISRAEPGAIVQPERGDPLRPGIELLEEVHRRAPVALPEAELVRSDVEHRRLRRGSQLLEEEAQLALSRAQRDRVGEPHCAWKYPVRGCR